MGYLTYFTGKGGIFFFFFFLNIHPSCQFVFLLNRGCSSDEFSIATHSFLYSLLSCASASMELSEREWASSELSCMTELGGKEEKKKRKKRHFTVAAVCAICRSM